MSKLALVVDTENNIREMDVTENFLSKMQEAVGGLIQPIDITENLTMWVNEEFLMLNEPRTNLVGSAYFQVIGGQYDIFGSVVFTGGTDEDGDTLGLSEVSVANLKNQVAYLNTVLVGEV